MLQNYFGGIWGAPKRELGGCISFADLEGRKCSLSADDMLCSGVESKEIPRNLEESVQGNTCKRETAGLVCTRVGSL
jgi:hypothetical protein